MEFDFDKKNDNNNIIRIKKALFALADDVKLQHLFPEIVLYADELRGMETTSDEDRREIAFLNLYCALHNAGSKYTSKERQLLDVKKGYFNHPGGISPLLKAESFIRTESIVADLGAGNGLQGLLFQYLYPHQLTIQIELSSDMIQIGQQYQEILGIQPDQVEWINNDIMDVPLDSMDFLYLYRPSKPIDDGIQLYQSISGKLHAREKALTIFSIADCLQEYLDSQFSLFYTDGHLTCFEKQGQKEPSICSENLYVS
ncbi:MAG: class I SAM-dependent methyltransferase [SAR324 cluster bacterium]|nr:class I SAM-dependent methyltransferase [SAR324 cluster bacterium]